MHLALYCVSFFFSSLSAFSQTTICTAVASQMESPPSRDLRDDNTFYAETGVWGISAANQREIAHVFREAFGNDFNLMLIGSRACGQRSPGKGGGLPVDGSDGDFVVVVKENRSYAAQKRRVEAALPSILAFRNFQIHITIDPNFNARSESVTAVTGETENTYRIIPRSRDPEARRGYDAIRLWP